METNMGPFERDGPLFESGVSSQPLVVIDEQLVPFDESSSSQPVKLENTPPVASQNSMSLKRKASYIDIDGEEDEPYDDGEDMIPPHLPDEETLPNLPQYHPAAALVQSYSTEMVHRFQEHIKNNEYQDDETTYLLELFDRLEHPPHETDLVRIGIVGDAGQGKSSTLNSILGVDIADYGDDGDSCTYVVQEYAQKTPTQTYPFMAIVEFFSRDACLHMVKEHFENYFIHFTNKDDMDDEDQDESRLRSTTALSTFLALFKGRREFYDKVSSEEFLQGAASPDDPNVLGRLIGYTEDILDQLLPDENNDAVTCLNANTVSAIRKMIQPFTTTVEYPSFEGTSLQCCPWPLVKKVRICLRSRILEQGIIIGDCPGTTDKNRSRVESMRRYLQDCDFTIAVNKVDRAIDHAALHNHINDAYRRTRSGSIIVVCTRSDDINMKGKQNFPSNSTEERILAQIAEGEENIDERISDIRKKLGCTGLRGNFKERIMLQMRREECERKKEEFQRKRLEVRVSARNRHVREGISAQYHEDTKDPAPLPIFCASNTIYMSHLSGYYKKSPPALTLEGTNIPQLRNHIFAIPSMGKFASLEHHCNTSLETALNTVEISCSITKLKRKEDLNKTFNKYRNNLRRNVQSIADLFQQHDIRLLLQIIDENESKWINRAKRKCDRWAELKPAGHRAVMAHNGNWETKTVSRQDWNGELLKSIDDDLSPIFESLHSQRCDDFATDIAERVGDAIDRLDETLNADPAASLSGAIIAFKKNLKERRNQINRICQVFKDKLKKKVRVIHMRSTTDGDGNYFTEAMKEVYEHALAAKKGRGSGTTLHSARCAAFKSLLCKHGGTFMQISHGIQNAFEQTFKIGINKLIEDLDNIFALTQHDVDQVCSTKEDDSPEGKAMREALLAMLPAEREFLREKIQKTLKLCREARE